MPIYHMMLSVPFFVCPSSELSSLVMSFPDSRFCSGLQVFFFPAFAISLQFLTQPQAPACAGLTHLERSWTGKDLGVLLDTQVHPEAAMCPERTVVAWAV